MHWVMSLYNLAPGTAPEDYLRFERSVLARYTEYVSSLGNHYLGLYAVDSRNVSGAAVPWQELPYAYAAVYLVDEEATAAIQARANPQPRPADITRMTAEVRVLTDMRDTVRLELRSIVPSPFSHAPLVLAEKLLRVALFEPGPGKTEEDLAHFERRITERYSEFESMHEWYYTGTYRVAGLPGFTWGEVDVIVAGSPEEALARDAEMVVPPDVQTIYEECRTYISRERPRSALWLRPLVPSPATEAGLILAGRPVAVSSTDAAT
jgi:hypothetical protein